MAKQLRKVAEAIRSAPNASGLGIVLEQRVARGFENVAELQDEAAAMYRRRKKGEEFTPIDLALAKAADESTWKGAAILERVGAAALASQHGSEEKINAILANVRKLIKKGKPKQ